MTRNRQIGFITLAAVLAAGTVVSGCVRPDTTGVANAQGWTPGNQNFWWETSQGSRLVPKTWYDALEQPDSTAPFSDQAYIATFGYLPSAPERLTLRKENLPIGFTVDRQPDKGLRRTGLHWYDGQKGDRKESAEPWVGMNCAACHSARITYQGEAFTIDGAPTIADFQSFIAAFDKALHQTLETDDKFGRFATKVLSGKDTPGNRTLLKAKLADLVAWQDRVARMNGDPFIKNGQQKAFVEPYGYARLDAVGHILNKIALYNEAVPQSGNLADAPVSYPFLWDISKHKLVQWNGSAANQRVKLRRGEFDYGAMGRNAGEVFGVFGEVVTTKTGDHSLLKGFQSTVQTKPLDQLEVVLSKLKPPVWPDKFGALNPALVAQGDKVYDRLNCGSCHNDAKAWKEGEPFEKMISFKEMAQNNRVNLTDIWMACNAATRIANTGNLEGAKTGLINGARFEKSDLVFSQLAYTVKVALIGKATDIVERVGEIYLGIEKQPVLPAGGADFSVRETVGESCITGEGFTPDTLKILAYKARPLDGIWATAPFLHNGSVPTLYHLLLAPKDRPTSFFSGSHEYDPKFGGYVWKDPPAGRFSKFSTVDAAGKPILGNSNAGHDYGVGTLSEPDRLALLEYLKSL
jgi:mono/diheme cytochrome c family protein